VESQVERRADVDLGVLPDRDTRAALRTGCSSRARKTAVTHELDRHDQTAFGRLQYEINSLREKREHSFDVTAAEARVRRQVHDLAACLLGCRRRARHEAPADASWTINAGAGGWAMSRIVADIPIYPLGINGTRH
jgi:hypothetical protein